MTGYGKKEVRLTIEFQSGFSLCNFFKDSGLAPGERVHTAWDKAHAMKDQIMESGWTQELSAITSDVRTVRWHPPHSVTMVHYVESEFAEMGVEE